MCICKFQIPIWVRALTRMNMLHEPFDYYKYPHTNTYVQETSDSLGEDCTSSVCVHRSAIQSMVYISGHCDSSPYSTQRQHNRGRRAPMAPQPRTHDTRRSAINPNTRWQISRPLLPHKQVSPETDTLGAQVSEPKNSMANRHICNRHCTGRSIGLLAIW